MLKNSDMIKLAKLPSLFSKDLSAPPSISIVMIFKFPEHTAVKIGVSPDEFLHRTSLLFNKRRSCKAPTSQSCMAEKIFSSS